MSVSVTWYGHSNFKVSCGDVTVFIDPFFTHNPSCPVTWNEAGKPDLVLVTHDHGDHTGDAVAICKSSGATCGCIVGTAERLIDAGMPQASIPAGIGFNIGGTIEVKGVRVTMTQAFHTSESGAPAGYVVTMPDGFTFYHAGDTGLFSSMELIGSLYPLDLALLPVGGFGLNITNGEALAFFADRGLAAATLSMELTFRQTAFAADRPLPAGLLVYGRQPLMLTRNCPRRSAGQHCEGAPNAACGLTDRRGVTFPLACAGGCAELLNSVPLYWADRLEEVPRLDFWLLHFSTESPEEVENLTRTYHRGGAVMDGITRGLYKRGVE